MFDAVGIGRCCLDYLALVDGFPAENSKVRALRHAVEGGGQSSTAMAALSRLGLAAAFVGVVGDDPEGVLVLDGLAAAGVDVSRVRVAPGIRTPVAQIVINTRRRSRTIVYSDSAPHLLDALPCPLDLLAGAGCLMVDPFGTGLGLRTAPGARAAGVPVVYDLEHTAEGVGGMIAASDYVIGSRDSLALLGLDRPEAALRELMRRGCRRAAVVTLGEEGSVGTDGASVRRQRAFPVDAVDTTAAGDAYHAGFAYGVVRGWDLPECMEFAAAVGALVCREVGGRKSLPTLAEVERLLAGSGSGGA
ncbi:MAG TPA: PfkB family carbohydrate kinase [bacterium]|nr:PfkB family carbohydrate kinase [bacterium]HPJ72081.1 PfkB family carbohydrate kinase [bacterium]HPQ65681.1 PfkB family carbohydrate kinase [bacterium]